MGKCRLTKDHWCCSQERCKDFDSCNVEKEQEFTLLCCTSCNWHDRNTVEVLGGSVNVCPKCGEKTYRKRITETGLTYIRF